MATPWKHPNSGIYWLRRRIPADLVALTGKREEKISLRTRDPSEAKAAYIRVAAEVEARWANLRQGTKRLSHKEAVAIAGEFYRQLVATHEDDPGDPALVLGRLLADQVAAGSPQVKVIAAGSPDITSRLLARIKDQNRPAVEAYLRDRGEVVDEESFERIMVAVNAAIAQGREHLHRNALGDYRPDPDANRFPTREPQKTPAPSIPKLPGMDTRSPEAFQLVNVFERYSAEAGHSPATVKRWTPIIRKVAEEVPDIRDLTDIWCVGWKDRLVAAGLSPASINSAYLAALRGTCSWGKDNKIIAINPVDGISVRVPKVIKTRPKGFTGDEALTILRATFAPVMQRLSPEHLAARRWIPWVCAYSGARVGEVGQMRGQDVQQRDGVWLMWVTPEAGSVKNGCARFVAIHPHLLEQGFAEFARHAGQGPMFYAPSRKRAGTDTNPLHKKPGERVAKWVREIGIDDPRLQPNHGWRHRFKTVARTVDMDPGVRDYIQGHVPNTEGEAYGDFEPGVLLREISKLPRYDI